MSAWDAVEEMAEMGQPGARAVAAADGGGEAEAAQEGGGAAAGSGDGEAGSGEDEGGESSRVPELSRDVHDACVESSLARAKID